MSRRTTHSATATTTPTPTPTTASASRASTRISVNSQARMGQILDDQDHKRCSEGNQRALLAENLDQLRGLVKVVEADDWKYAPPSSSANNSSLPFSFQADSEFGSSKW